MKEFLKLIRWQNLLIVILTMVLMRYAVIEPLLSKIGVKLLNNPAQLVAMKLQFPWYNFVILVASTIMITAGGYVINDYFDIKTDLINRGKVIVGTKIPRQKAMTWHNILNAAGVAGGYYVSWRSGYFWLGTIFLVVSGLLYFYSASYKRQFLIGNLVVALLTAMVPLLVVIYEWPALYMHYSVFAVNIPDYNIIFYWAGGFAIFAFLTTLTREIIKDIEDFDGDIAYGRNTVPVFIGIMSAKIVTLGLIVITISLLYLSWYLFINDLITVSYLSIAIVIPLVLVVYKVFTGRERKQMHAASSLMKVAMITGILYSVVVKIILTWNLF